MRTWLRLSRLGSQVFAILFYLALTGFFKLCPINNFFSFLYGKKNFLKKVTFASVVNYKAGAKCAWKIRKQTDFHLNNQYTSWA